MEIYKNHKKIIKKKIINVKNDLEIQPTPFYLILMLILQAYHPLFDIAYLIYIIELWNFAFIKDVYEY